MTEAQWQYRRQITIEHLCSNGIKVLDEIATLYLRVKLREYDPCFCLDWEWLSARDCIGLYGDLLLGRGHGAIIEAELYREKYKVAKRRFAEEEVVSVLLKDVYIIGNIVWGMCKIGISSNPSKRLNQLQTSCPFDLTILALFENRGRDFERRLHEQAKPYHERGEWFRIEGRLKDYLDTHTIAI